MKDASLQIENDGDMILRDENAVTGDAATEALASHMGTGVIAGRMRAKTSEIEGSTDVNAALTTVIMTREDTPDGHGSADIDDDDREVGLMMGTENSDAYYSNDSRDRIGRRRRDGDNSDASGGRYERRMGT